MRAVSPGAFDTLQDFLKTSAAQKLVAEGKLITTSFQTNEFADEFPDHRVIEHERIFFPSYPAEWCSGMLACAGELTLDLAEEIIALGWRLKDASPYNVLFRGTNPVFVDALSFERRESGYAIWPAYAQFVRTFLLPLLATRDSLFSLNQMWLSHRDGLEPQQVYRGLSWPRRWTRPALTLASLPTWLDHRENGDWLYHPRHVDPERAEFTLRRTFRALRKNLCRLSRDVNDQSGWACYRETQTHYDAEQIATKEVFVSAALNEFSPQTVLDIGANTGQFSELATRTGSQVVAIDSDAAAIGILWKRASAEHLNILPLCVDFCRPTPAVGWRNGECASFLDRARGRFGFVMMLAVMHHILVTERIPLEDVLDLVAELTTDLLLIEWVDPSDPMFHRLERGRGALYAHLTAEYFERAREARFDIVRKQQIPRSSRTLYLLRRKPRS